MSSTDESTEDIEVQKVPSTLKLDPVKSSVIDANDDFDEEKISSDKKMQDEEEDEDEEEEEALPDDVEEKSDDISTTTTTVEMKGEKLSFFLRFLKNLTNFKNLTCTGVTYVALNLIMTAITL